MRWLVAFALATSLTAHAQPAETIRVDSSLVVVDAQVYDIKTGKPIEQLTQNDFRVFDNGHEVSISALDTGDFAKPIALWLTVICNEQDRGDLGSGGFHKKEVAFRSSLEHLNARDKVAVATWCDDGQTRAVLLPSENRDHAIAGLMQALLPMTYTPPPGGQLRAGELACQAMLRGIIREARESKPTYFPVVVFLHGDWTGAPKEEIDAILSDLLESEGVVYGIKNRGVPTFVNRYPGEMGELFHYLAESTGGEYFSVKEPEYAETLAKIIETAHFRYQLSFKPALRDGKRHALNVKLTDDAKRRYKYARIRARREYIPTK